MGHYLTDDPPVVMLHTGGFLIIDFALGTRFTVYLTGNVTGISYLNAAAKDMAQVMFLQDATGGRTVTFPAAGVAWRYSNGVPTIDTDPSAVGSLAGRTVIMMSRLDGFPAHMSIWPVVKPDWHVYSVELAVLLANAGAPISDASKANLISPALVGTPTAPTAAPGTNTTQIATTAFANASAAAAAAAIVDSSPGALDTLNELAAALGDDANFATTITNALALKAPLDSPALTGAPTAPTPAAGDNDTSIATTAYVQTELTDHLADSPTWTGTHTFTHATGTTAPITIVGTDAGNSGPRFDIYHNSASPAANDTVGGVRYRGNDSGGTVTQYAAINGTIVDPTDTSEDGRLDFVTIIAGTSAVRFSLGAGLREPALIDQGAGTINILSYYVSNTKVVGARVAGWTAATGTPTRTTFATGSVTLPQLAERVKALIDDLIAHGLIGA